MNNVYKITLNANNASPVITPLVFKQGDKGQKLAFVVEELDRTGATSAIIAFSRSNGTSVEAPLTAVDGGYEYIIQGNEFAVPGRVVADLKFYQGDTGRVSTTSFVFGVYDDTLDGLGGGAGGYSDVLEQLRDEGEAAKQSFIDATAEAMIYAQRAEDAAERAMQGTPEGYAAVVAQVEANTGAIELDEQDILDLKMLGWTVPHEMPVKNYVDGNGVFHQKVIRYDMSTLYWTYVTNDGEPYFRHDTTVGKKLGSYNVFTHKYATSDRSGTTALKDKQIVGSTSSSTVSIKDSAYTNATSFKDSLVGQYLYYELATEKTMPVDGNEKAVNTVKNNRVSLIKPVLGNLTLNGISCTALGDGTYRFNGTATARTTFQFSPSGYLYADVIGLEQNKTYKVVGCPSGGSSSTYRIIVDKAPSGSHSDTGDGAVFTTNSSERYAFSIVFASGTVCNNLIFKPMVTADLSATYDDFVPYIGDKPTVVDNIASVVGATGDAWNSTKTYAVKEYAIFNNSLWRCKTQHSGQAPAENTYWTKCSICSELTRIATALNV